MIGQKQLETLAHRHGTPLFVVDRAALRRNYRAFKKALPRVQAYYAVKANSHPEIVKTFFEMGSSFDVASMREFLTVHEFIERLPAKARQAFIWDKIIYAHTIKATETLEELDRYKPLVTYDNIEEVKKIARHAPHAGLVLRVRVPNTGSMVELSSKFGAAPAEAVDLILAARAAGLTVEGLSFHVGSQCTNLDNYIQALAICAAVFAEARERGYHQMNLVDIGGGFPARYDETVRPFGEMARKLRAEIDRLFPPQIEILAEPGRFMVATAATLVAKVIGKAVRDGKTCYYIDDGIYQTFSGIFFDHCQYRVQAMKRGKRQLSAVFGPTCDALDVVSQAEELPALDLGDLVYSPNVGAYTIASSTRFNGMTEAKVVFVG
jgi:ornithine decarboxylase